MKRSEVVKSLMDLASSVPMQVTPKGVGQLADQTHALFSAAEKLVNDLELEEEDLDEE